MDVQVRQYVDVRKRALELGCSVPTGITILPRNFETAESKDDLLHEHVAADIRSLWRQAGVVETKLEGEGKKFPSIDEKSADWIGPIIFIGGLLLTQNATMANIALNVLSNYITLFPPQRFFSVGIIVEDAECSICGQEYGNATI